MPLLREEPPSETYLATAERDTTLQRSLEFSTDKVCFKKDAGLYSEPQPVNASTDKIKRYFFIIKL